LFPLVAFFTLLVLHLVNIDYLLHIENIRIFKLGTYIFIY
jgi:hypothetical protein